MSLPSSGLLFTSSFSHHPVLLHSTYWGMVVESLWWVGGKDGWMAHSNSTAQFHTQCLLMTVYIYTTPSHRHRPLGILKYPHLYSSYVVCLTCCCCCSPPLVLHPLSYDHRETIRLATSFPCPTQTLRHILPTDMDGCWAMVAAF